MDELFDLTDRVAIVTVLVTSDAGAPDEVAAAILFFASDASSYVTGQTLAVDGGPQMGGIPDV